MDAAAAFVEDSLAPIPNFLAQLVQHVDAAYDRAASTDAIKIACDSLIRAHLAVNRHNRPGHLFEALRAFFARVSTVCAAVFCSRSFWCFVM